MDSASPLLNQSCWTGEHIDTVTLVLNRAAGKERMKYMEYILTNVIISSVSVGGGGGVPTESVTCNYGKIKTTYFKQARKGGGESWQIAVERNLEENV